jgi:hypothetical protein
VREERGLYHLLSFRERSIEEIISLSCKREEEGGRCYHRIFFRCRRRVVIISSSFERGEMIIVSPSPFERRVVIISSSFERGEMIIASPSPFEIGEG